MKNDVRRLAFVFAAAALLAGGTLAHVSSAEVLEVGAAATPVYTLDTNTFKGKNSSYNGSENIVHEGVTWNFTGNSTTNPWRIGGKNLTNQDRKVYSITAYEKSVSKVDLTVGDATITVNSIKLVVSSDSDFGTGDTEIVKDYVKGSTISFENPGEDWTNAYYQFVFNVTSSIQDSNQYVQFSKVELYEKEAVIESPLSSIQIGDDSSVKKDYFVGNVFDPTGLNVTGTLENGSTVDVSNITEWSFKPAILSLGDTSVEATASVTVNDVTKTATKLIEGITVKESNAHTYQLLTNVNDLKIGSQVIVANEGATMALGTDQNLNNRAAVPTGDRLVNSNLVVDTGKDSDIEVFTVEAGTKENTFAFKSTSSSLYIYAASSSKNYLRSQTEKDDNASFAVEVTGSVVKVTAQGTSTRNLLKYNGTDKIFSCYSNGQKDISMYVFTPVLELSGDVKTVVDMLLNDLACDNGVTAPNLEAWNTIAEFYAELVDTDKAIMKSAKADVAGSDLEKAMAKYEYIVGKYTTYADFIGRGRDSAQTNNVLSMMPSNDKTTILLSVMGVAGVALAGAFFLSRKRKMAR